MQPTILQVTNRHDIEENEETAINLDSEFLHSAKVELGYKPQILLSAQVLPQSMLCEYEAEDNSETSHGLARDRTVEVEATRERSCVLAKDGVGRFRYSSVCRWWFNSLEVYNRAGIRPTWLRLVDCTLIDLMVLSYAAFTLTIAPFLYFTFFAAYDRCIS